MALIHTPEEVAIWNTRRVSGPYKDDYDVRIKVKGDNFKNNATAGNNYLSETWPGNTTGSPWVGLNNPGNVNRTRGELLVAAALVGLMLSDTNYTNKVASTLLAQIAIAGTDFSNTSKWNPASTELHNNNFEIANWLKRLMYAYSFIEDSGSLTTPNKTAIKAWFLDAGQYWMGCVDNEVEQEAWPDRDSDDYGTPIQNPGSPPKGLAYFGGPTVYPFHEAWVNIPCQHASMGGIAGILCGNATLQNQARRFFKEWVTYATSSNGTVIDLYRWITKTPISAPEGWNYGGAGLGPMVTLADVFARAGDPGLYEFTTSGGLFGWQGGSKNIGLAAERYCRMALGQLGIGSNGVVVYASNSSTSDPNLRLGPFAKYITDTWVIPSNIYFKNPIVTECYRRTLPSSPTAGGYDPWCGDWGCWPGVRFMYGQQEGVVDPYASPSAVITNLRVSNIYLTGVKIQFDTDVAVSSKVDYGLTNGYGSTTPPSASQSSHTVNVTGLTSKQLYYFRVNAGGTLSQEFTAVTGLPAPTNVVIN